MTTMFSYIFPNPCWENIKQNQKKRFPWRVSRLQGKNRKRSTVTNVPWRGLQMFPPRGPTPWGNVFGRDLRCHKKHYQHYLAGTSVPELNWTIDLSKRFWELLRSAWNNVRRVTAMSGGQQRLAGDDVRRVTTSGTKQNSQVYWTGN